MFLHELRPAKGSKKKRKIVGRGRASGCGGTSGKGENGQICRSGTWIQGGREGGQMPLIRRLPKVGFKSKRPILNQIVPIENLNKFDNGTVINADFLKKQGLIASINKPFKILNNGNISKALVFQVKSISQAAKEKIEKAGGKVEFIVSNNNNNKKEVSKTEK